MWSLNFTALPLWLAAPLGSLLLAWYGSLQHETIHGHPTTSKRINTAIGGLPLSLWVPYAVYRETHIRHHRHSARCLTEVGHDPESFYLPPGHLAKVGPVRRLLSEATFNALRDSLAVVFTDPTLREVRARLFLAGVDLTPDASLRCVLRHERAAAAHQYAELR